MLELDHVGAKRGDVSRLVNAGLSAGDLRGEIARCEVVCTNCHRRRTARRGGFWRADPDALEENASLLPSELRNLRHLHAVLTRSSCRDCGLDDIVVLDFDHVGAKRGNVTELARRGSSLASLRAEIARCEVRCANCHRRRTARRRAAAGAT